MILIDFEYAIFLKWDIHGKSIWYLKTKDNPILVVKETSVFSQLKIDLSKKQA